MARRTRMRQHGAMSGIAVHGVFRTDRALRVASVGRRAPLAVVVAMAAALVAAVVGSSVAPVGAAGVEWNIGRVRAPQAGTAVIAVVDSGVDAAHPAFEGRVLEAIDMVGDGASGDPNGHGTHVAGIAAGGVIGCGELPAAAIGVAPGARILPVRVLGQDGSGSLETVAAGIRAAADRGAAVINLSLGADVLIRALAGSSTLADAVEYAWNKGSIAVLAAGNDGLLGGLLGSGYRGLKAVVVTATDHRDRVASYATSIGGAEWGISAPGGAGSGQVGQDILSAFPDAKCGLAAGTSMAAPHVSGALAVLRARGLTPAQAVDRVLSTAKPLGSTSTYGAGLLDVGAAVAGLGTRTSTPPPTPSTTPVTLTPTTRPPTTTQPPTTQAPSPTVPAATAPTSTAPTTPSTSVAPLVPTPSSLVVTAGDDEQAAPELDPIGSDVDDAVTGGWPWAAAAACAAAWVLLGRAVRRLTVD